MGRKLQWGNYIIGNPKIQCLRWEENSNGETMGNPKTQCFKMGRKFQWGNHGKPKHPTNKPTKKNNVVNEVPG
jgi:hypothetical protein